jgi:hypothetical protein
VTGDDSGSNACRPWQPWAAFAIGLFVPSIAHLLFMTAVDGQGLTPDVVFFSLGYGLILTFPATLLGAGGVWLLSRKDWLGLPQILMVAAASGLVVYWLFDRLFVSQFGSGDGDPEGYLLAFSYALVAGSGVWSVLHLPRRQGS